MFMGGALAEIMMKLEPNIYRKYVIMSIDENYRVITLFSPW